MSDQPQPATTPPVRAPSPAPPPVAVALEQLEGLRWPALFGSDRPVELEIGVGKAGFLLRRAQAHPERNFFGIEWASEFYRYAVDRMQRWRIPNVRLVRTDAAHFIRVLCPRDSLALLHTYHPDPWPKARHHKRRLFQPVLVAAAAECLRPGAAWAIQTDHAEYYDWICNVVRAEPRLREVPFESLGVTEADGDLATNFEIKYRREGRPIFRLALERTP